VIEGDMAHELLLREAATTSSPCPLFLSIEIVSLTEDGALFKIARF
jgi:hypothetical protein